MYGAPMVHEAHGREVSLHVLPTVYAAVHVDKVHFRSVPPLCPATLRIVHRDLHRC